MKIKRYIISAVVLLVVLLGARTSSIAQDDSCHIKLAREVEQCLTVDVEAYPDTTKIWTFALELTIESQSNLAEITSLKTNHPMAHSVEGSYAALKRINFNCIMDGKKKKVLVIPFCIIIYGSETPRVLSLDSISKDIQRLFNGTPDNSRRRGVFYFKPYIVHADKKVYD